MCNENGTNYTLMDMLLPGILSFIERLSSLQWLLLLIEKGLQSVSVIERLSSLWYNKEGTSKCVLYREVVLSSELSLACEGGCPLFGG